jgi:hypothetical protein
MRDLLVREGYVLGENVHYVYDAGPDGQGAQHREDAWRFRAAQYVWPIFTKL